MQRIETYDAFWPFYLDQHRKPLTRLLHAVGTLLALVISVVSLLKWRLGGLLVAPLVGYGFAWASHFFVEKNRPATFQYPFWSLISDFRMLIWLLRGKL